MFKKLTHYIEPNKKTRLLEIVLLALILIGSITSFVVGNNKLNADPGDLNYIGTIEMSRDESYEDYDESSTVCDVVFVNDDKKLIVSFPYEEYEKLTIDTIEAYEFETKDGDSLIFDHINPGKFEISNTYKALQAEKLMPIYNLANSLLILFLSLLIVMMYSKFFTTYEKLWFLTIMILATIFAVIFPEESANGVNGIFIMLLYLLDTFLNILCELLISKQSRYNFLVSVAVEITEIVISLVLMYRFATMAVTLFFWLPIDIISFINWTRHKDEIEDELTIVRRLKGYQEVLIIVAIALWTIVVGYFLSGLDIATDFINNDNLEKLIIYLDACASAIGIANGLFILFRLREQWIAWYICAFLEAIMNILTGQYVLLILKLGYFTNTTYGYIKWSKYIKSHKEDLQSVF